MVVYIETERLRLRDWEDKDLLPFQKMNANPQVRRYFPSLLSYRRSEIDMQRMDDILKEKGVGLFAVELKETGEWLGFIGVNYIPKGSKYPFKELPFYEIGWRLIPEVWGNGIATEGAKAVIKYAKEKGITEIYSFTSENNLPSRKVMEKIGMTFLDNFEFPNLSKYHPLKRHVRYYIELLPSQSEGE
ncbi:GNAT family N-acetyltransferase [Staphylococcus saccharolyticus]|jgi:acetyltransferase, GNAT family|uniref:Acetyltransferase n=1 Tax=Staphylococcus saccharolyticus TaxID=33028 RepID=A0A380H9T6_9STAP|nr:GNAT family N-acetyltransferase [Staphylococcus saccharolyticus]MBL7565787.1 GNAT family N-acetyltransferase [Staphylococcus saccharolyticus]MBL7572131.1 GNAT family N-acetyltransferase [Staphylococcus saccharolyticus]QQB97692.1 GNAT family N-acetyltransferase [Staphylococcus saccharolyticus]QRJ66455.1 GNAT family N-acetyltransferase [Staphylococcus saccharolyticus]RTX94822.1 N-acetyltransferase [Staphylococcus saccharolyticus]